MKALPTAARCSTASPGAGPRSCPASRACWSPASRSSSGRFVRRRTQSGVPPMDIAKFKPAIVYTIYIASTPEKVWQALTTAEFSRQYLSGLAIEAELKVGGAFIARAPDGSVHISGEVFECDPPRKLTITWNVNWPALVEKLGPTLVTYEIEQAGDAVKLTMLQSHDRDISDDVLEGGRQGWPAILSSLKSVLETGQPRAIKMQPPHRRLAGLKA